MTVFLTSRPDNSDTSSPYSHFGKHWPVSWSLTKNGKHNLQATVGSSQIIMEHYYYYPLAKHSFRINTHVS